MQHGSAVRQSLPYKLSLAVFWGGDRTAGPQSAPVAFTALLHSMWTLGMHCLATHRAYQISCLSRRGGLDGDKGCWAVQLRLWGRQWESLHGWWSAT